MFDSSSSFSSTTLVLTIDFGAGTERTDFALSFLAVSEVIELGGNLSLYKKLKKYGALLASARAQKRRKHAKIFPIIARLYINPC